MTKVTLSPIDSALTEKLDECREFSYKIGEPHMLKLIKEAIAIMGDASARKDEGIAAPCNPEPVSVSLEKCRQALDQVCDTQGTSQQNILDMTKAVLEAAQVKYE